MSTRLTRALLAGMFALSCAAVSAAPAAYVPLERRLSPEQLQATGLDTLSPAQLAALNAILSNDAAAQSRSPPDAGSQGREPLRGRLVGRFAGWTAGTSFDLDDGSRWQVTEGTFDARPVDAPAVTIKPGLLSGWYLYVDGQPVVAKVRRVR